jgi:hypothetical protein
VFSNGRARIRDALKARWPVLCVQISSISAALDENKYAAGRLVEADALRNAQIFS